MSLSQQLAKHLRDAYFGGNWTVSNLRDQLSDVSWPEAQATVSGINNTIAVLSYHITYYTRAILRVFEGNALDASDAESFKMPPMASQTDWEDFQREAWAVAESLALRLAQLPDAMLSEPFADGRYGTYYRNLAGLVEHLHYHLGQIALIKKLLRANN